MSEATPPLRLSCETEEVGACRGDSEGVGAEECRLKKPPRRPCFSLGWEPPPNGVERVDLLAFFSRSSIFFLNCFASFSSTKLSPATHSSSSKVWKNVLSWW